MERDIYIDFELLKTKVAPKTITKMLNVIPSMELLRGEKRPELDIPRQNIWSIESSVNSPDISVHWSEIENKISHVKDDIKMIAKEGEAQVTIVVQTENYIPEIVIPVRMSKFLAYIGASIDIDHI